MTTLCQHRLQSHGIGIARFSTAEEVIKHYGAIQAQDYNHACRVLGSRLTGSTFQNIEKAITDKKIVRLRPMRGTLHMIDPQLAHAFLDVCASKTLKGFTKRREHLGISDDDAALALEIIKSALSGGKALTRIAIEKALIDGGLTKKRQWIYHLTCYAATCKLICFGPKDGKNDTFVLLDERLPDLPHYTSDEAYAEIARCYLRSHSPATVQDLGRRTGWNKTECNHALNLIESEYTSSKDSWNLYYNNTKPLAPLSGNQFLLAGFDEYFLGYKDRTVLADKELMSNYLSKNGIFSPLIVVDGKVVGKWAKKLLKDKVVITLEQLDMSCELDLQVLKEQADEFAHFWGISTLVLG